MRSSIMTPNILTKPDRRPSDYDVDAAKRAVRKGLVTTRSPGTFELGDELTIVVPTLNSGRYLDIPLSFYEENQIPVTVFVDGRSEDDTLAVAQRFAEAVVISK